MPNTNSAPSSAANEASGQTSLPLSRIQKIINADPERTHVSKNAAFAIALATELFIQHLATTSHNVVKAERKPRRNIQYRDVAAAVAKTDNLEFLVDVVPKTTTYGEFKKKQEARGKGKGRADGDRRENGGGVKGIQALLNATSTTPPTTNGNEKDAGEEGQEPKQNGHAEKEGETEVSEAMEVDEERREVSDDEEMDPVAMQIEVEMRGPRGNDSSPVAERRNGTK
ncbi:histone-fold-containing protein [Aaosphaeria arxii CBS 175.79]|uniref:Histone-fold-containing protein n=1 Tax=Aaosphaeria arxii CBS 175.79 TaxID=1450172 RepID=A0A6A5XBP5_9PLEO|nr:histone-fold-containing protein [Aaosphaeria arxii CBS 175.79]KAF2010204.1 histone-fold-containing protein [Aaosphaeria arxii CBS 175.79]